MPLDVDDRDHLEDEAERVPDARAGKTLMIMLSGGPTNRR